MGEVARIAEEVERNGHAFYTRFASTAADPLLRALCEELAAAEEAHRALFAGMFADEPVEETEAFPGDAEALVRTIVREFVFTKSDEDGAHDMAFASRNEFLDFAISKELAAIDLFDGIKRQLSRRAARLVNDVIDEERTHIRMLEALRER
jgi:rubrerythrin